MSEKKNYYWTKDTLGNPMLIITVGNKNWTYGSLVLHSIENNLNKKDSKSLNEILELEKRHFSHLEMRNLDKEFEILKQTQEFKKLLKNKK